MKSAALIMVALACGLVATVGAFQYMDSASAGSGPKMKKIAVATIDININEAFTQENITLRDWAENTLPEGVFSDLAELEGKHARARLFPGEPIVLAKIVGADGVSSSLKVPLGYRVASVKVTSDSSVSNLIEPGDLVDVITVIKSGSFSSPSVAKTILKGVRVFAVNAELARTLDREKSPDEARTVSLLLKPNQVETLMMATELGQIKLSLRNAEDAIVEDDLESHEIEKLTETVEMQPRHDPSQPYWSMMILSPGNYQKFSWQSAGQMPVIEASSTTSSANQDEETPSEEYEEEEDDS